MPAPAYRLTLDGRDITPALNPRLMSLRLTECRGIEADQLDLTISDHDGTVALPRRGVKLTLAIGWQGQRLVDKGIFIVDEVEHAGAPDVITLRARSADFADQLRVRRSTSWHNVALGAILETIAGTNDLKARIDSALRSKQVAHIEQTNESDMAFVTRLGKRYDAVATVKAGYLLFLPVNGTTTSTDKALPTYRVTRAAGDSHRWHSSDRDAYSGVAAYWHDPKRARRRGAHVGVPGHEKRLQATFGSQADALAAAKAEWSRIQRQVSTFQLTLAEGHAEIAPQTTLQIKGFKPEIDGQAWLVVDVTHEIGDSGFTTQIEAETKLADANPPTRIEDLGPEE